MLHIRTDGNGKIGTGHVMRCVEIAKAYEETIGPVQFLVADDESKNFIESKGFSCYKLDSQWDDLDSELAMLSTCKKECGVERLLIDSYFITKEYVKAWKRLDVKVAYLDDLCKETYDFDMLFNGAIWATDETYKALYEGTNTRLYLGCRYLPMRGEYAKIPKREKQKAAGNILVMSGGTDPCHFLLNFIENPGSNMEKDFQYYIICGIFNEDYEEIVRLCENRENFHVYRNVDNLYEYMLKADVAVSAGGMTLYELCACGTPCITYLLADNQQGNIDGFMNAGIFDTIGDIREYINFDMLKEKLMCLMENDEERFFKAVQIQQLVDGKGAYRIARELGNL